MEMRLVTEALEALDDDRARMLWEVLPAENLYGRNPALPVGNGTDVHDDDAVPGAIDGCIYPRRQAYAVGATQQAEENTELQRPAECLRDLVNGA